MSQYRPSSLARPALLICAFSLALGSCDWTQSAADPKVQEERYRSVMRQVTRKNTVDIGADDRAAVRPGDAARYRALPKNKTLVACLMKTGADRSKMTVIGNVYASGYANGVRTLRACRVRFAHRGCTCRYVDVLGTNAFKHRR